jgi:hypothetical protein
VRLTQGAREEEERRSGGGVMSLRYAALLRLCSSSIKALGKVEARRRRSV